MKRLMMVAGASLLGAGVAHADVEPTPLDPLDPIRVVSPLTLVQGDGVKIGEGTAFYPQVGLETGYESNTFYTNDNASGAGLLRLLVEGGIGSLSKNRLGKDAQSGELIFEANGYVGYEQYISDNSAVRDQSGVAGGFHGNLLVHPEGTVSFYVNDAYDRILRPNNFEATSNANRDINVALFRVDIHPEARRLAGSIAYTNTVDVFEDQPQYPDRVLNNLIGQLSYKLFPLTTAALTVSQGYNSGIGSAPKVTSYPFAATLGLSTALTVNTSLFAQGGYTQGFYTSGPDYQAFTGSVYLEYRYNDISAFRFRYAYNHQDSVNANFFRDHLVQAWLEHKVDRFGVYVAPELRLREYDGLNQPLMGPPVRDDVILAAAVGIRYQFRNWITASAQYRIVDDSTDYRYVSGATMVNPSYLRNEVFAGVRLAY